MVFHQIQYAIGEWIRVAAMTPLRLVTRREIQITVSFFPAKTTESSWTVRFRVFFDGRAFLVHFCPDADGTVAVTTPCT
jgi:hypothetical protein